MVDIPGTVVRDLKLKELVDDASTEVLKFHVEPKDDMIEERARASFDTQALVEHLNGGAKKLQRKCVHSPTAVMYTAATRAHCVFHSSCTSTRGAHRTCLVIE